MKIRVENLAGIHDIDPAVMNNALRTDVVQCITAQKRAAADQFSRFVPDSGALEQVSEACLGELLESGKDVHGIARDGSISNVISFGASHIDNSVIDAEVEAARQSVDEALGRLLRSLFESRGKLVVRPSGHFWYPSGSFMSWHTNSQVPGWRVYINYAEQAGKSFFRYRDPQTGEIVTLWDKQWNLRIFPVSREVPFWHCVYSDTNRFSLGYLVSEVSLAARLRARARRIFRNRG